MTLDVALVNNMPDTAFVDTERQYVRLLSHVVGPEGWTLRRFTLPAVSRSGRVADVLADRYRPQDELWDDPPDVLIVTGADPLAPTLPGEAYWRELVELLAFARETVASTVLSCLAAHAALLVHDGLEREPLPAKCAGVFDHGVLAGHPLTTGMPDQVPVPHSRRNGVSTGAVRAAGWDVLLAAEGIGWAAATRSVGHHRTLLWQGHPEYDGASLVREFARDTRRYVRGDGAGPPVLPVACAAPDDQARLSDLRDRVLDHRITADELGMFPFDQVGARAPSSWVSGTSVLYRHWLAAAPRRAGKPASSSLGPGRC